MLAKKTSKNQLTLPKEVAEKFPGTDYFDVRVEGRVIELRPVRIEPEDGELDLAGSRATIKKGKTIFDFRGALPDLGMSIDKIREKAVAGGVGADE